MRIVVVCALLLTMTACASTTTPAMPDMPGMNSAEPMPMGDGTRASQTGYTLVPADTNPMAGMPMAFQFHITGPDNRPVTTFQPDQTKLMHFYLIRADLSGFQHVHPTMATDGTWTANLAALAPGSYRGYASFVTPDAQGKPMAFALSVPVTVAGQATTTPVPAPSPSTTADGYTLALSGQPVAGRSSVLTLHVTQNGQPVTDLQPYLDTYAHLSAFHAGDLAFAHLHPGGAVNGAHGGPDLLFNAEFPTPGSWRVYVQFQTAGTLHTAAFTVAVS